MLMTTRILPLLLLLPLFTGCVSDPAFDEQSVTVIGRDLPPLAAEEGTYELWFSYPDDPTAGKAAAVAHGDAEYVSMGRFTVDADGTMRGSDGATAELTIPSGYYPSLLIDALLTLEAPGDTDAEPGARLLSGVFTGDDDHGMTTLRMSGSDAFGTAFDTADRGGSFRLTTPTTTRSDDEAMGVWFEFGEFEQSLTTLPASTGNDAWIYAAWLVRDSGGMATTLPLGSFLDPDSLDDNAAGPGAGPDPLGLVVPGEDFVSGVLRTLNDGTYRVVVSLQPIGFLTARPFLPLFVPAPIPAGHAPGIPIAIEPPAVEPKVEIHVER